jgi:hypothetical protein
VTAEAARIDHLVRMANQIARSVPDPAQAPTQTAAHLRTFWATVMVDDLAVVAADSPDRLDPIVHDALSLLRPAEVPGG